MIKDDQSGLARHSKDAQESQPKQDESKQDQSRREQQSHSGREGTHKRDGEQLKELQNNLSHHKQPYLDQKGK